jgi:hypothetical protein
MSKDSNGNGHAKPMFIKSIETQLLEERLRKSAVGDTIPYDELTEIASTDVRSGRGHSALNAARKNLSKHERIEFGTVRTVGIKRLNDSEQVAARNSGVAGIRRKAGRELQRLANVDVAKLTPDELVTYHTTGTVYGLLKHASSAPSVKKIRGSVAQSQQQLPLGKTFELFGK